MKILILSQFFSPEPNPMGLPFAKALAALGHSVEVLTGFPNYPGGVVYPGYRQRFGCVEAHDAVLVHRVPLFPSHNSSRIGRIANYTSFALSASALGSVLASRFDVAYVYHPPATVALPAGVLRLLGRMPFVLHVQDLWPDTLRATGMIRSDLLLKAVGTWCDLVYRLAAKIIVISPGFERALKDRGVPGKKLRAIYNWADETAEIRAGSGGKGSPPLGVADTFNVVFAGTMGRAQGLGAVLEAARRISRRSPRVRFIFVGGGVELERLKQSSRSFALRNVSFLPRMPSEEIGSVLGAADALLVHLRADPLFEITVPSKTQAYMRAGKPIIMAVRGDAAGLIEAARCGVTCEPDSPDSIVQAVLHLEALSSGDREAMGNRGRAFYESELSMSAGVKRFEEVLREAANKR